MRFTKKIGDKGEELATEFLINEGYKILERQYRYKKAEIDIIAEDGEVLIFVEVKTRKNSNYGYPEESVGDLKMEKMWEGAEEYLEKVQWQKRIRFDVISIIMQPFEIEHFQDAF